MDNFHTCTVHLHIIKVFLFHQQMHYIFVSQYIKIYTKIAATCFGLTTIHREHLTAPS